MCLLRPVMQGCTRSRGNPRTRQGCLTGRCADGQVRLLMSEGAAGRTSVKTAGFRFKPVRGSGMQLPCKASFVNRQVDCGDAVAYVFVTLLGEPEACVRKYMARHSSCVRVFVMCKAGAVKQPHLLLDIVRMPCAARPSPAGCTGTGCSAELWLQRAGALVAGWRGHGAHRGVAHRRV